MNYPPADQPDALQLAEDHLVRTDSGRVAGRLARTYAEALLAAADERHEADGIGEQLDAVAREVFAAHPALEDFLDSPAAGRVRKDEVLGAVFGGRASPLFLDFLKLLNRKRRLGLLRLIAAAYRALRDARANRQPVLVEAASPPDDGQRDALRAALARLTGKEPVLTVRVRPELIGGLVVHVGDTVYDTSVRSRLDSLRSQLLARGSHAF